MFSRRRGRHGEFRRHDGTITTEAPNFVWGSDGVKVRTVDEGQIRVFAAVEHWNAAARPAAA